MASISEENTLFIVTHDIASVLTVPTTWLLLGASGTKKGESLGARVLYT